MISIGGHFLINSKNFDTKAVRFAIFAFLFSLFGDKPQFIEQSELAPNWESSPLFALMNIS